MLARLINLLKNYNKNKQKSNKEKTRSILERGRQRSTHHDHHRPWGHVMLQTRIEGLSSQLMVVLRQEILRHLSNRDRFNKKLADHTHTHTHFKLLYLHHLQANQLESPLLKPVNYLPDKTALNSIWFHGYESPLPHIWKTWCEQTQKRSNGC